MVKYKQMNNEKYGKNSDEDFDVLMVKDNDTTHHYNYQTNKPTRGRAKIEISVSIQD